MMRIELLFRVARSESSLDPCLEGGKYMDVLARGKSPVQYNTYSAVQYSTVQCSIDSGTERFIEDERNGPNRPLYHQDNN